MIRFSSYHRPLAVRNGETFLLECWDGLWRICRYNNLNDGASTEDEPLPTNWLVA